MELACETHPGLAKEHTIFLHGNLASSVWWRPMLEEWKKSGSLGDGTLMMMDWRGCGKNPAWPSDRAFTLKDLARDVLETMKLRGVERAAVVGHSLGGLIALQMMSVEPKAISRAVLLDPVGVRGVVFDESMYEAFRQMALSADLTRTVVLSTIASPDALEEGFKNEIARDAFKAVGGIGSSVLEILKTVNLTSEVSLLTTPTLVLHGDQDAIIPLADSQITTRLMPEARLEILSGVGHCWNVENPVGFTARLRSWL